MCRMYKTKKASQTDGKPVGAHSICARGVFGCGNVHGRIWNPPLRSRADIFILSNKFPRPALRVPLHLGGGSAGNDTPALLTAAGSHVDEIVRAADDVEVMLNDDDGGAVLDEVSEGTYLVGLTLEETAKKYIDRGAAISIVYPREGTSAVADGCAVIRGTEHEENAKLFVDFIVSPDVQRLAVEKLYRRTVRDDITPDQKEEGSIMDFDLGWAVKNQKSILERWAALMAGNGGGS